MANVSNGLTEKMKSFCREYVSNGGNGTQAYLAAYNGKSEVAASIESSKLLKRDDITKYIAALNKPLENAAINEREKKRKVLWDIIENGDNNDKCRAMDILNKMDAEYANININKNEDSINLKNIDINMLKSLSEAQD